MVKQNDDPFLSFNIDTTGYTVEKTGREFAQSLILLNNCAQCAQDVEPSAAVDRFGQYTSY